MALGACLPQRPQKLCLNVLCLLGFTPPLVKPCRAVRLVCRVLVCSRGEAQMGEAT